LLFALVTATRAAEWSLPPLDGDFTGDVAALKLPGAPALHWKLALRSRTDPAERNVELSVDGEGTRVRAAAQLDATGAGIWRLSEARIDVARWFAVLAPFFGPGLAGIAAEGSVGLSGEGTIRAGEIQGRAHIEWRDGVLRDAASGLVVEGIALRGDLQRVWPAPVSEGPLVLTFREASAAGVIARNGVVEFTTDFSQSAQLVRATCELMDGRVEISPFTLKFAQPRIQGEVQFAGLELGRIAALLPPVLADARGRVSGRMAVSWSAAAGVTAGDGRLQIAPGEVASLRLSVAPGFLTSKVPRRLALLPAWLGPIARAFSPENPAYETLRAIETGEMRLELNSLDVGLQPEGDPAGRTARVILTARPAKTDVVESVRFEINVAGPLADVVRMGLEGRVNIHSR
jgi:hypothetical protein